MKFSKRLDNIPPYLFAELDRMKNEKIAQGVDVISLGIGDPDTPTAPLVIEAMEKAIRKPEHHQYPSYIGAKFFREAVSRYYKKRFHSQLDPEKEVSALIGSKEGIANICMAVLDPGDLLLYPDPGYPVYKTGAIFAGADYHVMPLLRENNFLPDLTAIPEDVARRAKMMFVNYPNNPTAAVASLDFYKEVISFAKKYDIIVASDNSYPEIYYGKTPPPSILEVEGAKDIAVEFYSLSKPYNMTGWRIAAVVGNSAIVNVLGTYKKNIDSGAFTAVQEAAAYALDNGDDFIAKMRGIYEKRMDSMIPALKEMGIEAKKPEATFYIWAPTPGGMDSFQFTKDMLDKCGIIVSPGIGFGEYGEGFFRISLTQPENRIEEAVKRMMSVKELKVGS